MKYSDIILSIIKFIKLNIFLILQINEVDKGTYLSAWLVEVNLFRENSGL